MNKLNILLIFIITNILMFSSSCLWSQPVEDSDKGGFLILAGKKTTHLNSVLLGYNNYQTNESISFLEKYPRVQNDSGEVVKFNNGLTIPKRLISFEWMVMQTKKSYLAGNAVGVNEDGVAIGGIVNLSRDRNIKARKADPLVDKGIPAAISYIAIQRSRSAKQCVRMIGEFFNSYGISEAVGIAVADKDEIWYLETGGGSHWAAIKIPADACWIQGNSYRIGFIDPGETGVLASPGIKSFARENNLWDPAEAFFNFSKAFGGRKQRMKAERTTDSRKFWRVYDKLNPSEKINPNRKKYPTFVRPEKKITLKRLTSLLSDEYRGSKYYPYAADTIVNIDTTYKVDSIYQADTLIKKDSILLTDTTYTLDTISMDTFPIADESTAYSSIIEIRGGFMSELKSIIWASPGNPVTTPFIPFYFGIKDIPEHFNSPKRGVKRASIYFDELAANYYRDPLKYADEFPGIYNEFQNRCFTEQSLVDRQTYRLLRNSPEMAVNFLTVTVNGYCQDALEIVKERLEQLKDEE